MEIDAAIAQTFKELRQKNNLSQEAFADAIDSHQVYISEIENCKKIPSLPIIYKTAKNFGLSLTEFVAQIEQKMNH